MLLKGVRILEWASESVTAAFCTRVLADLGADVVKLEPAGGGMARRRSSSSSNPVAQQREQALFAYLNTHKQSVELADSGDGDADLDDLGKYDAVVYASLGDKGASGLIDRFRTSHPGVAVVLISPFGRDDPASDSASFGSDMVLQHRGGFAYEQARPVADPTTQPPIGGADMEFSLSAGVAAAGSCVAALLQGRDADGAAQLIDFSKLDFCAQLCLDGFAASQRGEMDFSRQRINSSGIEVAGGLVWILECADGWVMISPREQHQWDRWIAVIGNPDWTTNKDLCGDRVSRKKNAATIQRLLSEWSRTRSKTDVFQMAQNARVACFPVSTSSDLLENEQLHSRGFFNSVDLDGERLLVPGLPFLLKTSDGKELERRRVLEIPVLGSANGMR